jgi:hypothetical protein
MASPCRTVDNTSRHQWSNPSDSSGSVDALDRRKGYHDIRRLLSGPSQAHARQVPMDAQIVHMQSQNADACLKIPCRASSCQYLVSATGSPNMSTPPSCLRNHTKLVVRHSAALCPCSSFGMHAASDPARFSSADFSRCTLVPNMTPFAECHR